MQIGIQFKKFFRICAPHGKALRRGHPLGARLDDARIAAPSGLLDAGRPRPPRSKAPLPNRPRQGRLPVQQERPRRQSSHHVINTYAPFYLFCINSCFLHFQNPDNVVQAVGQLDRVHSATGGRGNGPGTKRRRS